MAGTPSLTRRATIALVAATWLAFVALPPWALVSWRALRLADVSSPEAQEQWDAFRDDMRQHTGHNGPVQRKVPRSVEPPELVWLRDYLPLAVVAWVTLAGAMGGFVAAIVIGMTNRASAAENHAARHGDGQKQDQGDAQHTGERRHG